MKKNILNKSLKFKRTLHTFNVLFIFFNYYTLAEIDSYNSNLKDRMNEKFEIDNKVDTKSKELEDR